MLFRTSKISNLSFFLIALSTVSTASAMVGGKIIPINKAPYMVSLRVEKYSDFHVCGGSLISPQHVLTAAHCFEIPEDDIEVDDDYIDSIYVVAGVSLRTDQGERRNIAKRFIHPQRIQWGHAYDVAVLKLNKPYKNIGPKIKIIEKFCKTSPKTGHFMRVTGWGATRSVEDTDLVQESDYSNELREISVPIITNQDCIRRVEPFYRKYAGRSSFVNGLSTTNVCAFKKSVDPCVTDSGGPGLYGDKLCVIVAGGNACGFGDYPGYYTDVVKVMPFIQEKLLL